MFFQLNAGLTFFLAGSADMTLARMHQLSGCPFLYNKKERKEREKERKGERKGERKEDTL